MNWWCNSATGWFFISISDDNGDYLKKFLKRKPINSWVVFGRTFKSNQNGV